MAINYQQTDATYTIAAPGLCSGRSVTAGSSTRKIATAGGTPGSVAGSSSLSSQLTLIVAAMHKLTIDAAVSWDAGTWTWRYNVTTSNMNITLNEVYICRVNSSNVSQATIGSATGLGISLSSTGVKSGNISGSAQTPSADDYVAIVYVFTNGAMTTQVWDSTPNQIINSPFSISSSNIKTILGVSKASVKTVNGLVMASVKTWEGLA